MTFRAYSAVVILGLFVAASVSAQTDPRDLFDPADTSSALDISDGVHLDAPWWISVLQWAGLTVQNKTLEHRFTTEFDSLKGSIAKSIDGKTSGYLVKVELYANEFGVPVVPEGQLLFPIGEGAEPVGSLAESLRRSELRATLPTGLSNQSYYLWFKNEAGKLKVGMIPREGRESLEQRAQKEKVRRELLATYESALPEGGLKSIHRAEYWNDVVQRYDRLLASEDLRERARTMAKDFEIEQMKFNRAYEEYQRTQAALDQQQQFNRTLNTVATLTGVIASAIQLGGLTSSRDERSLVKSDGKPQANLGATIEYSLTRTNTLTGDLEMQKIRIQTMGIDLQKRDSAGREIFQNVPIPKAESELVIP